MALLKLILKFKFKFKAAPVFLVQLTRRPGGVVIKYYPRHGGASNV
jgi:hypothetical protein